MSEENDPEFYVHADDADKAAALVDALNALYRRPSRPLEFWEKSEIEIIACRSDGQVTSVSRSDCSLEEMVEVVRQNFTQRSTAEVIFTFHKPSQDWFGAIALRWETFEYATLPRDYPRFFEPLSASDAGVSFLPISIEVAAKHANCPVPVSAALIGRSGMQDMEHLLTGLCSSPAVKTGGMTLMDKEHRDDPPIWFAPLEMAGTYNAQGLVARDVGLSWLQLHEGIHIQYVAGISLDEMAARIEATPKGTTIGVAPTAELVYDHYLFGVKDPNCPVEFLDPGQRTRFPEDEELSREQALAILQTPSEKLIAALEEAAATPDQEWLDAERRALEVLDAAKKAKRKKVIDADTYEHRCFLERHAPYHVRRLDNGGVMLATHPYRHLWPLWSDALALLGIRPKR